MKLSKKKREALRMKFGGKCAYCGCELTGRWQADHIEPVRRISKLVENPDGRGYKQVFTGEMEWPERDHEDNLMPACNACNNDKHAAPLEMWRKRLEDLPDCCQRNHSAYRHARRFGLIIPNPQSIVFHFERVRMENSNLNEPSSHKSPP